MSVYLFDHYRDYLTNFIQKQPKAGHGELARMAKFLKVHSTLMSLILSGERELTLDQAYELSKYLGLGDQDIDYFQLLVQHARAGSIAHKNFLQEKIKAKQKDAQNLSKRIEHDRPMLEEHRARYYSSWIYSTMRMFISTNENGKTFEQIMTRFGLAKNELMDKLQFLQSAGLLQFIDEQYKISVQRTYLEKGSPHLLKHHTNWRLKALQAADQISDEEMIFTMPFSISKKDFLVLKEDFTESLKKVSIKIKDTDPEEIACLNIDLFWVKK